LTRDVTRRPPDNVGIFCVAFTAPCTIFVPTSCLGERFATFVQELIACFLLYPSCLTLKTCSLARRKKTRRRFAAEGEFFIWRQIRKNKPSFNPLLHRT